MNDYTNAPASPSALFDNAPTVPAQKYAAAFGVSEEHARMLIDAVTLTPTVPAMAQPAHTTPATRISMVKGGTWVALDVTMQYGRPVPLALALKRVGIGRTVFVAREDAAAVMEAVSGETQ